MKRSLVLSALMALTMFSATIAVASTVHAQEAHSVIPKKVSFDAARSKQAEPAAIELRTGSPYTPVVASYFRKGYRGTQRNLRETIYRIAAIDLNGDGQEEVIGQVAGGVNCGAGGLCQIFVFEKKNNKWQQIGELRGWQVYLSSDKANGYSNLIVGWRDRYNLYQFNGKEYAGGQ